MDQNQKPRKLAIIGAGKIGEAIFSALIHSGGYDPSDIIVTSYSAERKAWLARTYGVTAAESNTDAVKQAGDVILGVKPQMASKIVKEIAPALNGDHLLISVLAGVTTADLEKHLSEKTPVVRAMPNTPCRIARGMTALCGGSNSGSAHLDRAEQLFKPVGRTVQISEKHFDAITGLSASGPAFIYIMIESLAEGGVKAGLPRSVATELAAQACLGAASMVLETNAHPALLKDEVTTPAGCTIDGILKLEEGGIRVTLIKAVMEAAQKAEMLGRE